MGEVIHFFAIPTTSISAMKREEGEEEEEEEGEGVSNWLKLAPTREVWWCAHSTNTVIAI
jgi:hypothetical protein